MEIPNYEPFYLRSLDDLRAEIARLGVKLCLEADLAPLSQPLRVNGRTIPNRFCAQPISGGDAQRDGSPSRLTRRRYRRYAAGAFGLIWVEHTAFEANGERRLCLSKATVPAFAGMLAEIHAAAIKKPLVVLQLGSNQPAAIVSAAQLAMEAGFDGVDIQCEREVLPEALARISDKVPGILLTTRLCAYEGIRGGFGVAVNDYRKHDLTAPLAYVRRLVDSGLHMLNVTAAGPSLLGRTRGQRAIPDFERGDEHPLMTMARQVALVSAFREVFPEIPMIGSGLSWPRQFVAQVASGAVRSGGMDIVGLGRAALACPDLPERVLQSGTVESVSTCMVCFACSELARSGREVGCVVRDADVYGPPYRDMRRLDADRLLAGAKRCHLCEEAPCSAKSPTRTDIAPFIKAFREGREEDAYDVIRATNPLPEMISQTSPSWLEEEGACIEATLTGVPVPILDLQYMVAWRARERGVTGVRIPAVGSHKIVAIIGGGPTGIAAATRLVELGHRVRIYETTRSLGGVPVRLLARNRPIADMSREVEALLQPALAAGRLEVAYDRTLGENIFTAELLSTHDAVLTTVGLWQERSLGTAKGVITALDLLEKGLAEPPCRVAVLAGGDSAMDACSVLDALGPVGIYVVFEGPRSEMHWHLPESWFARPGVRAMMNWKPLGYECNNAGEVYGLRLRHSEFGVEASLAVDLVVEAMGLEISASVRSDLAAYSGRFYSAGAMVNGGASVGHCVAEGLAVAEAIHQELCQ